MGRGGHNKAELAVHVTSQGHGGEVYMNLMKIGLFFSPPVAFKEPNSHAARQKQGGAATSWLQDEELTFLQLRIYK